MPRAGVHCLSSPPHIVSSLLHQYLTKQVRRRRRQHVAADVPPVPASVTRRRRLPFNGAPISRFHPRMTTTLPNDLRSPAHSSGNALGMPGCPGQLSLHIPPGMPSDPYRRTGFEHQRATCFGLAGVSRFRARSGEPSRPWGRFTAGRGWGRSGPRRTEDIVDAGRAVLVVGLLERPRCARPCHRMLSWMRRSSPSELSYTKTQGLPGTRRSSAFGEPDPS
jgi:hypothetical protein